MRIRTGARLISAVFGVSLALLSPTVLAQNAAPQQVPTLTPEHQSYLIQSGPFWLLAGGLVAATVVGSLGVYRYNRNQRWHRIEFLRKTVKEFEEEPDIWKALKILDFEEYRDYEVDFRGKKLVFRVDNELLCNALASHEDRIKRLKYIDRVKARDGLAVSEEEQYLVERFHIETTVRDWFNKMLNGFEHFGYLVDSGMFSDQDIRPWMLYWIQLIADRDYKRPGASKFYDQLYSYINSYGFSGTLRLFERFGYRILPTPYDELDFTNLFKQSFSTEAVKTMPELEREKLYLCVLETALSLAKAAQLVYEDESYVQEITRDRWQVRPESNCKYIDDTRNRSIGIDVAKTKRLKGKDTQAFLFRREVEKDGVRSEAIVLALRGSQELKDWQTNFSTRLRRFLKVKPSKMERQEEDTQEPAGQIHRGFQAAWNSVEHQVLEQVDRWNQGRSEPLPLFITGHSLGGALATVAAASMSYRGYNIQGVYTFGQPRVGDLIFARRINPHLDGKFFRFVNNNDIVPNIPPPFLPWNVWRIYGHIGKLLYFDAQGNLTTTPNPIVRFLDFQLGLIRDAFQPGFDMINDHRMEFYISHLKRAVGIQKDRLNLKLREKGELPTGEKSPDLPSTTLG